MKFLCASVSYESLSQLSRKINIFNKYLPPLFVIISFKFIKNFLFFLYWYFGQIKTELDILKGKETLLKERLFKPLKIIYKHNFFLCRLNTVNKQMYKMEMRQLQNSVAVMSKLFVCLNFIILSVKPSSLIFEFSA